MASADDHNSSNVRGFRRLLLKKDSHCPNPPERNPLISTTKKKGFASAAFRGLGCASAASSQAFAPDSAAAVRSSADWQGKRSSRRRNGKQKKKRERRSHMSADVAEVADVADIWCAPGVVFGADASVDCVVSHRQMVGRGRSDGERVHRERSYIARHGGNEELISSLIDSPYAIETPHFGTDPPSSGHLRYMRGYRQSPTDLEELYKSNISGPLKHHYICSLSRSLISGARFMMVYQTRILLGEMDVYDQYKDLRLDVDNMSYEELLELGDRIGYVSTGLREEDISHNLRKMKHSIFDASPLQKERKCIICQEEYEVNDEMGRLECGHSYHIYCIKQWLLRKNACPVCKTAMTNS